MKFLNKYNYAEYLKRLLMVGQIDPWRVTDAGEPLYALLIPTDTAYNQCLDKCRELNNVKFSKQEFIDYLKLNDILIVGNVNEFEKIKANLGKIKKKRKPMSEERKKQLQEQAKKLNSLKSMPAPVDPVVMAA